MATPQEIEAAAQEAATQLTTNGSFDHSSNKIKAACGVNNNLANGFTKEEKKQVADIVAGRLEEAKQLATGMPALKDARDNAIRDQNTSTNIAKGYQEDAKFMNQQLQGLDPNSPEAARLTARLADNERGIQNMQERAVESGDRVNALDDQMKRVAKSALATAIKGDPTDQSVEVRKAQADKIAVAAAAPKESKSLMQSLRSHLSK